MKDGKFMKEKEEITTFVAQQATEDSKKNKYDIHYTIKLQSDGMYKITST